MKRRLGFVSNSSSSSFIIIYRPATIEEIDDPHVYFRGTGLSEGTDYFHPEGNVAQLIKEKGIPRYCELMYEYASAEDEIEFKDVILPDSIKDVRIRALNIDHHSGDDFTDFEEAYYEE
jgi:hypothetical protein